MRIAAWKLALSATGVLALLVLGTGQAPAIEVCPDATFHLSFDDNVDVLVLEDEAPLGTTPRFIDSPALSRANNTWKLIGEWSNGYVGTTTAGCVLGTVSPLHVWLGLRNSDDQGTNFDLRAEVYLNGIQVAVTEQPCIKGLVRNPSLATELIKSFPLPVGATLGSDLVQLRLYARIGTPQATCGGHASATGLRVYFDAASRDSLFDMQFLGTGCLFC